MELPNLGKQCAFAECQQLDFLPFTCSHCQLVYCGDHFKTEKHACSHVLVNTPHEHVPVQHFQCTFLECVSISPVEMGCPVCKEHFCLQHRHHGCIDKEQTEREKELDKWEAPKKQFQIAKAEAERQVDENLQRAIKKPSTNKTAIKVQLMRLKGKAVGAKSIPTTDRVYFSVCTPLSARRLNRAVFVSKTWSLGRVIDATSDLCDVPNRNNQSDSKKLRLFRLSDGVLVASEMDRTLEDMLKEELIIDGESLVLEYVDSTGTESLSDLHQYTNLC